MMSEIGFILQRKSQNGTPNSKSSVVQLSCNNQGLAYSSSYFHMRQKSESVCSNDSDDTEWSTDLKIDINITIHLF